MNMRRLLHLFNASQVMNRSTGKMIVIFVLVAAVVLVSWPGASAAGKQAEGPLLTSPPGQVLVVNANLNESSLLSSPEDIEDLTDMNVFADRLTALLPYAPDALLLSEILTPGATAVAEFLEAKTGYHYAVAVEPGDSPYMEDGSQRDTAIVLNMDTMRVEDEGGYIRHDYALADTNRLNPIGKHTAYLLAKEQQGGLRVPMASLHYVTKPHFKTDAIHTAYVAEWSTDIAEFLKETYDSPSNRQVSVIAGDFNLTRCDYRLPETLGCSESLFYSSLTNVYGYHESIDEIYGHSQEALNVRLNTSPRRIDFMFTEGNVLQADIDYTYSPAGAKNNPEVFYSDHRLEWALIGMPQGNQ
jgi:hypothetical protein